MNSLIKAGFTPVRFIGNPCTSSACSFASPSERCACCKAYAKPQFTSADRLAKVAKVEAFLEQFQSGESYTSADLFEKAEAFTVNFLEKFQPDATVKFLEKARTMASQDTTVLDTLGEKEKEKEKEKEEKKEERIVCTSVPLTVENARKGPLLTQRRYTLHNMVFSDFNELRYRDVIRVHRGSYLGEHDTLVVLTNGKLLRVKYWKGKTQTLAHYDTIFQYLVELTSNDCGFNFISLNKKECDPNYHSMV